MTDRTVPVEFVRSALAIGESAGLPVDGILDRAGISRTLLDQSRARITPEQVTRVIQQLWATTGDELFGLGPVPLPNGSTRLIGLSLVHTRDLGSAIQRFVEFQRLTPGFPRVTVTQTGSTVRI
ncbi:MAG: AraC family transcriptional regulator, partial [Nocardioidaceae bacterium]|nr:AraC family transcriptional regulator [Nocardioidaceae bacterium]